MGTGSVYTSEFGMKNHWGGESSIFLSKGETDRHSYIVRILLTPASLAYWILSRPWPIKKKEKPRETHTLLAVSLGQGKVFLFSVCRALGTRGASKPQKSRGHREQELLKQQKDSKLYSNLHCKIFSILFLYITPPCRLYHLDKYFFKVTPTHHPTT